jgi:hypothetical protein
MKNIISCHSSYKREIPFPIWLLLKYEKEKKKKKKSGAREVGRILPVIGCPGSYWKCS